MAADQGMDQRTYFRHGVKTSEEMMDIINYLEGQLPGNQVKVSDAIRFAIAKTADFIRITRELQFQEQMDLETKKSELIEK
jgi:hypothetical protein